MFIAPVIVGRSNNLKLFLKAGHLQKKRKTNKRVLISKMSIRGNLDKGHDVQGKSGKWKVRKSRDVPPFPQ